MCGAARQPAASGEAARQQAAPHEAARQPAAQGSQRREAAGGASSQRRKLQPPVATSGAHGALPVKVAWFESDIHKPRTNLYRRKTMKTIWNKFGPTEGCKKCAAMQSHIAHSDACRARAEALMEADPEFRKTPESAKRAEPSRRDRGAEQSQEPRAPSPPDATAAAGSSAVPVQGEARGFSLTLRGGDSRRRSEGIFRFV